MPKPVTGLGFHGMDNHERNPGALLDEARLITPKIVLNALATDGKILQARQGFKKRLDLEGVHSLWGGSVCLCVAKGVLYLIEGTQTTPLAEVAGPLFPMNYEELNNLVYISNPYWTQIYDILGRGVRSWGVDLPPSPSVGVAPGGDLPPGVYSIAYTNSSEGRMSGNGPLVQVSWEGMAQGITLNNLPAGGQCWITQPNGKKLFLAALSGNQIVGQVPNIPPLTTFMVQPPPGFVHFKQAFGRIWGCRLNRLYYSEPFQYESFRAANFIPFIDDLVMVAPVNEGIFVSSLNHTWFLDGSEPNKMSMRLVGIGAIPGTLSMAGMPGAIAGAGYEISRRKSQLPSPVWMNRHGFVVGTHSGHVVHLTEDRLHITPKDKGATIFRLTDGHPQIIVSLHGNPIKSEVEDDLEDIFARGSLF